MVAVLVLDILGVLHGRGALLENHLDATYACMKAVQDKHIQICTLSNSSPVLLERDTALAAFVETYVDKTLFASDTGLYKPDRQALLSVAELYSVDPAEVLLVDDSLSTIEEALTLGMKGIVYRNAEEVLSRIYAYIQ